MRKLKNEELGRKSVEEFKSSVKTPVIMVLDNVRSLHNIGSVFRTADAFLLEGIYLCGITATPPHREIHKTALGATETVAWKHFKNAADAINELKNKGYKVYAIEQAEGSYKLDTFIPEENQQYAVVFGHEISGVSEELMPLMDGCIEIPQVGFKHSLNISVCAGIVAWHFFIHM
jgi:23S rRNA (guanosine2251-2'-O)-methyltransferase